MKTFQTILVTFVWLLSPQIFASDCSVGYAHMQNGKYELAYQEFRTLAERGYPTYMNIIADMHLNAQGVPASDMMAHIWYSLSAAQGNDTGIQEKSKLEKKFSRQQLADSRHITKEYARNYLEPYKAGWSLD